MTTPDQRSKAGPCDRPIDVGCAFAVGNLPINNNVVGFDEVRLTWRLVYEVIQNPTQTATFPLQVILTRLGTNVVQVQFFPDSPQIPDAIQAIAPGSANWFLYTDGLTASGLRPFQDGYTTVFGVDYFIQEDVAVAHHMAGVYSYALEKFDLYYENEPVPPTTALIAVVLPGSVTWTINPLPPSPPIIVLP